MATTAELVAAAWSLADEVGVGAIGMRDLAARVGMTASSLYEYFPSKNGIYDAMFADGWRTFRAHMSALPTDDDLETQLTHWWRASAAFWVERPAWFSLLCQRPVPGFEPSPSAYAEAVAALDAVTAELRRHGVDEQAADLLVAMQTGLISQQLANQPGGDRWLRLSDRTIQMFLASLNR